MIFKRTKKYFIDCASLRLDSKIKIISQVGHGLKRLEYSDIGSFEIDLSKEIDN